MSDGNSPQASALVDHRRLGRELKIFTTEDLIGTGLPVWLPNGAIIRLCLESFIVEEEMRRGYSHVLTPQLGKRRLYEISGHWEHFHEDMFPEMRVGGEGLVLRPMNCPHHMLVFASDTRSYRDLPLRLAELGTMYRQERSGVVGGLNRVRAMTLNDAHIFCTEGQIESEVADILDLMKTAYAALGIRDYSFRLSLRSRDQRAKYVADDDMWSRGEAMLRDVLNMRGLPFVEAPGEAAFYGPKVDVQVHDYLGREFTLSTVQVDFHLPKRFDLSYIDASGRQQAPVAIHRSVISTMERMVAHLLEVHQGALPPWLCPIQLAILPVHDEHAIYAREIADLAQAARLRCAIVPAFESLGARIRDAQQQKIPYVAVVGSRERDDRTVSLRLRDGTPVGRQEIQEALGLIASVVAERLSSLRPT